MYIRMLIFLEVIMKEFKDYFSKSEIVLWSSSVMVIIISFGFVSWRKMKTRQQEITNVVSIM